MRNPIDGIIIIREKDETRVHISRWQGGRKIYYNPSQYSLDRISKCNKQFDQWKFDLRITGYFLVSMHRLSDACTEYNKLRGFIGL